jgi:peroxiredoxin
LHTEDFALSSLEGTPVKLSSFRGKAILLVFWSPAVPASLRDAPFLSSVQERRADKLAVVGVCMPSQTGCGDEHGSGSPGVHTHENHERQAAGATASSAAHLIALSRDSAKRLNINFPLLLDPEGLVGMRFRAVEVPVYILLDSEGRLRRRLVGFRDEPVFEALVGEIINTSLTSSLPVDKKR